MWCGERMKRRKTAYNVGIRMVSVLFAYKGPIGGYPVGPFGLSAWKWLFFCVEYAILHNSNAVCRKGDEIETGDDRNGGSGGHGGGVGTGADFSSCHQAQAGHP